MAAADTPGPRQAGGGASPPGSGGFGGAPDEVVAEAARAGNRQAFAVLYRRHAPAVYDFLARTLRDRAAAEDLVQVTFAAALEHHRQLEHPARVQPWLVTIAYHLAMARLAGGATVPPERPGPGAPSLGGSLEAEEAADLVWEAASGLAPGRYALLDLAIRQQLTTAEMARALGTDPARAVARFGEARRDLDAAVTTRLAVRSRGRCPDLAALVPPVEGGLDAAQWAAAERHLGQCPECRRLTAKLSDPEVLFAGLVLLPMPEHLLRTGWAQVVYRAAQGPPVPLELVVGPARAPAAARRPAPAPWWPRAHPLASVLIALSALAVAVAALTLTAGSPPQPHATTTTTAAHHHAHHHPTTTTSAPARSTTTAPGASTTTAPTTTTTSPASTTTTRPPTTTTSAPTTTTTTAATTTTSSPTTTTSTSPTTTQPATVAR